MGNNVCPYCGLPLVAQMTYGVNCNGNLYLAPNPYDVEVNDDHRDKRQCDGYRYLASQEV